MILVKAKCTRACSTNWFDLPWFVVCFTSTWCYFVEKHNNTIASSGLHVDMYTLIKMAVVTQQYPASACLLGSGGH